MAKDVDNLILVQLREMRAEIAGVRAEMSGMRSEIAGHNQRFDSLDKAMETLKFQMTYTYGAAGLAGVNSLGAEAKADAALRRIEAYDAEMADFKRRLTALERA